MGSNEIYTIGREFGSLGKQVGQDLAKRLGIKFYDKELLQKAAKESGLCEEIFGVFINKIFRIKNIIIVIIKLIKLIYLFV